MAAHCSIAGPGTLLRIVIDQRSTPSMSGTPIHEEVLISVGFRFDPPDGIDLRRDESGVYWGYYT